MSHYTFNAVTQPTFELNTLPQLTYLRHLDDCTMAFSSALCTHSDYAEIIFITNGASKCTIADQTYVTVQGDAVLINSGTLHRIFHDDSKDIKAVLLGIQQLHIRGLAANQLTDDHQSPILHLGSHFTYLQLLCQAMEQLADWENTGTVTESVNHILQAFLIELHALLKDSKTKDIKQDYSLGLRIKEFLDEHYLEDLKLPAIAKALNVNPYYLSHTFKKISGYSPMQYITLRRIGEAQNLLITTSQTITDIALQCGYNNSNYFQVVFNNIVGMPPGKYRKTWK